MQLFFNALSLPSTSFRLKSCCLLYACCNAAGSDMSACGQSLDLPPAQSPQCTSTTVTLSNVCEIKASGPNTGTVASYSPGQH